MLDAGGDRVDDLLVGGSDRERRPAHPGLAALDTWALRLVPLVIFAGFAALFTIAAWRSRKMDENQGYLANSAAALSGSALLFGFYLLESVGFRHSPGLLYGFVFLINAIVLSLTWAQPSLRPAQAITLTATALHLGIWTCLNHAAEMLPWALGLYLVFGVMHTLNALLWQRRHPETPSQSLGWMPAISLLLMLLPVVILDNVSFIIWPAMLLVNAAIIGLAVITRNVWPVLLALVTTLLAALLWMSKLHADLVVLTPFLFIVGGFALVFAVAAFFLAKKLGFNIGNSLSNADQISPLAVLPIASAVLPFGLLILAVLHFPVLNPSPEIGRAHV